MENVILKDKSEVFNEYTWWKKTLQIFSVGTFFALLTLVILKGWEMRDSITITTLLVTFITAQLTADFASGMLHWSFDTWGTLNTPIIGRLFILPFRDHHVDQKEITHHGFLRTAGPIGIPVIPILLLILLLKVSPWLLLYAGFFSIGLFFTNQIHKWAHMEKPPLIPKLLQKSRLILNSPHHQDHHQIPFNQSYCITNGWMNPILTRIKFFTKLEKIIYKLTGALPRVDDIGEAAAKELLFRK